MSSVIILEEHKEVKSALHYEVSRYLYKGTYILTIRAFEEDGDVQIKTECINSPGPIAEVYLNNHYKLAPTDYERSISPDDVDKYYENAKILCEMMEYVFANMKFLKHGIIPQM